MSVCWELQGYGAQSQNKLASNGVSVSMNERIQGMVTGCALGDAYGMCCEMLSCEHIARLKLRDECLYGSLECSLISKHMPAGSVTDDTHNMLMMMQLVRQGTITAENYLELLKCWVASSPENEAVLGPSTRRALVAYEAGESLDTCGMFGTTNGCIMKIAPLGIVANWKDTEDLASLVYEVARPTHNTSIAMQGACAVVGLASYLLQGNKLYDTSSVSGSCDAMETDECCELHPCVMEILEHSIEVGQSYGWPWPSASLSYRVRKAIDLAHMSEEAMLYALEAQIGTTMDTIDTLACVFALLYKAQGNIYKYCNLARRLGGDTDTIGAIGGSLLGTAYPLMINQRDKEFLEQVNKISFEI